MWYGSVLYALCVCASERERESLSVFFSLESTFSFSVLE